VPSLQVLPDLTEDRWEYHGSARVAGIAAHAWIWKLTFDEGYGAYEANYTFYTSEVRRLRGGQLHLLHV
jgi:hypothetical protein